MFSAAVTDTVQVVATTPFVPGDDPATFSPIGPLLAGTTTYDFVVIYQDDAGWWPASWTTVSARLGTFTHAAKFLGSTGDGRGVLEAISQAGLDPDGTAGEDGEPTGGPPCRAAAGSSSCWIACGSG